jgi:hypothetical protein
LDKKTVNDYEQSCNWIEEFLPRRIAPRRVAMNRWLTLGGLAVLLIGIEASSDANAQVKVAKPPAAAGGD